MVTGCLGFIGSYFCKYVFKSSSNVEIIGVNRSSNQKHLRRLEGVILNPKFTLIYRDIAKTSMFDLLDKVDYVFHFSARTMVDYSIKDPYPFIEDNIVATVNLLEASKKSQKLKGFFNISTDEVYGPALESSFTEDSPSRPTNPYSASKNAADGFCLAYYKMFDTPVIISRTENNYGPYQGIEKVIPVFVKSALENEPLPVYGDGKHIRQWLHVEDHIRGLLHLMKNGSTGEIYHIAGCQELENLELAKRVLRILGKSEDMIKFIPDNKIRPGHDRRYAIDVSKLKATGWEPKYNIESGFEEVINWYVRNQWWLR